MTVLCDMEADARSKLLRELGAGERLFHLVSKRIHTHFCIVGEVRGRIDPTKLHAAFEAVRRRHPMLGAYVDRGPHDALAAFRCDLPIEVKVLTAPWHDWARLVERELMKPFPDAYGPLVRAQFLPADRGATIILTFNHTLADGLSGIRVLNDLLDSLAGKPLARTKMPAAMESYAESSLGSLPTAIPTIPSSAANLPFGGWAKKGLVPRVSTISLDRSDTEKLLRRSREERSTLHGAICAGLAFTSAQRRSADELNILNPVNLRTAISAPDDVCCLLVSPTLTRLESGPEANFWTVARQVSDELGAARRDEAVRTGLATRQAAVPPSADTDTAFAVFTRLKTADAVVTNVGALKIGRRFGPLTLEAVWGPIAWGGSLDVPLIGVTGFDGFLCLVEVAAQDRPCILSELKSVLLQRSR